ncbi:Vps62-related protein [Arthrobacter sp. 35W]|uniref:Vps62-related protein n=1 Tax=Arthrobacter sp. 35W TaxID=1132441 RepID=UPI00040DCC00|nr:Vps62-related protein [Arthrobacter sp. 35W]
MNTTTTEETSARPLTARSGPGSLVAAAIAAAGYGTKGAPFDPFLMKFADPKKFVNGWTAEKGNAITFYGEYQGDSTDFLPLGDFAAVNGTPIATTPIMLLAPSQEHPDALAHPTGFAWILDDAHSGNPNDIAYFWPTAPDGYQALGICVGFNGNVPDATKYWCVKTEHLQHAPTQPFWNDAGSHWTEHDGSLSVPTLAGQTAQAEVILLAPTTLLSNEHGDFQNTSWCLSMAKLMLPVEGAGNVDPVYVPGNGQGSTTTPGLGNVAVLPSTLISDPAAVTSPFYYLAAQPSWLCLERYSSPKGGVQTESITIGTSTGSSTGFQHTTSLEVGAEAGIEAGPFSAKVSVTYNDEMQVSGSTSTSTDTQQTVSKSVNLPDANEVQFWQKQTDFVVYRTAGDVMSIVTFEMHDTILTYPGS